MNAAGFVSSKVGMGLAAVIIATSFGMTPTPAKADHWGFNVSLGGEPVWVPPTYESQARTITTPAVYETRTQRVWREPVYEDRQVLVDVPARTAIREMPRYDSWGRMIGYERVAVVVEPAHREWRTERVLVQPGRWETVVERVCVQPERSEVVYDNVPVSLGYWEQPSGLAFGYERGHSDAVRVIAGPRPWEPGFHAAVRVRR